MQPQTDLIHHPWRPPAGFEAPQPGVFKASTVFFPSVAAMRARDWRSRAGYTYGLHGTPTTMLLEERIAALESGRHCVLAPSGLAALALVCQALLKAGDRVLIPDNAYGPLKALAEGELAAWGITHDRYDPMDPADLAARLDGRCRLVWLEAPGSVTMEFPPLAELVRLARAAGALTALDNTWGAGLAFCGFDLTAGEGSGADLVVQALTKYPSGGGDVLMGSVVTRDEALHLAVKLSHMRLGLGVGANDAEAVLRALPSLHLRYRAQDRAARRLARWLAARPEVAALRHPAFEGSPGHANWRLLCMPSVTATDGPGAAWGGDEADAPDAGLAAGLFSVIFDAHFSSEQVDAFCDALRLFRIGYSWGGPVSLVMPYDVPAMRRHWPHAGVLVRFSVGLESVDDLQADLARALERLHD